jgi:hypothetical protein
MLSTRLIVMTLVFLIFSSGFIGAEEVTPRGGFLLGRIAAKKLKKMREQDKSNNAEHNKDGKIDQQESNSAKKTNDVSVDDETFKKIDQNGDGMLSHEEIEKYHQEMLKAEKNEAAAKASKDVKPEDNTNKQ